MSFSGFSRTKREYRGDIRLSSSTRSVCLSSSAPRGTSSTDTVPSIMSSGAWCFVLSFALSGGFGCIATLPLALATSTRLPSGDATTADGYHPAGRKPSSSGGLSFTSITATAFMSPSDANKNLPSADSASPVGVAPAKSFTAAGRSSTVPTTLSVAVSTTEIVSLCALATYSRGPVASRHSASGWLPVSIFDESFGASAWVVSSAYTAPSRSLATYSFDLSFSTAIASGN